MRLHRHAAVEQLVKDRALRVDADHPDHGVLFLEVAAGAADGAAGAHAADEMGDHAPGVVPDFGAGARVVRQRVVRVVVLVAQEGAGDVARQPLRHLDVAARIVGRHVGGADDDMCPHGPQHVDFFLGLLVGDGEHRLVAASGGKQRQAHAGVARGAFHDGGAGADLAAPLGLLDHVHADAVLDRAARAQELQLGVDRAGQLPGQLVQAHQRRVADRVQDALIFHGSSSWRVATWVKPAA